jgi:hypothetical protein
MDDAASFWRRRRFAAIERVNRLSDQLDQARLEALLLGHHDTDAFDALIVEYREALAAYRQFRVAALAERA